MYWWRSKVCSQCPNIKPRARSSVLWFLDPNVTIDITSLYLWCWRSALEGENVHLRILRLSDNEDRSVTVINRFSRKVMKSKTCAQNLIILHFSWGTIIISESKFKLIKSFSEKKFPAKIFRKFFSVNKYEKGISVLWSGNTEKHANFQWSKHNFWKENLLLKTQPSGDTRMNDSRKWTHSQILF